MRLVLAAFSVLLGVYISYCKTFKFNQREKMLRLLYSYISKLENLICYYSEPLAQSFRKLGGELDSFFLSISSQLERFETGNQRDIWFKAMKDITEFNYLTDSDKAVFLDFAALLGQSDGQAQKNLFFVIKKQLNEHIVDSQADIKKNVKMYRALGFVAGVVLAIIII